MEKYKISIIDSFSDWEKLSQACNELLMKSTSNTIFLTWEWLFSWAESFLTENRKLFILSVFQGDELIGIAPWYIEHASLTVFPFKKIKFLGTPEAGSDYLDVFVKKGKEKDVAHSIYDFLFKEVPSKWDCLMLHDVPCNSLFLLHFSDRIEEEGKYAEIHRGSFCPITLLPGKDNDFFSRLSSNRREQFNRHLKILNKEGKIKHDSFYGKDNKKALNEFFFLYGEKETYSEKNLDILLERYLSRCEERYSVQIDLLSCNDKYIAGLLHLRYQSTLSMYLMAVDKSFNPKISIGNILVGLCIIQAINDGISTYDFLKGNEHYKFHWANDGRSAINLFFGQRKLIPVLFFIKNFFKYTAKVILR